MSSVRLGTAVVAGLSKKAWTGASLHIVFFWHMSEDAELTVQVVVHVESSSLPVEHLEQVTEMSTQGCNA